MEELPGRNRLAQAMQKKYKFQSAVGLKSPSYGATENGQDRTVHFRAEKKKKWCCPC